MSEAVDFNNMRKELIWLYEEFLRNPADKSIQKRAIDYDRNFGGLSSYNSYLKSQPVPPDIEIALNGLSAIYQFGTWGKEHDLSNDKIIYKARKILEDLKK